MVLRILSSLVVLVLAVLIPAQDIKPGAVVQLVERQGGIPGHDAVGESAVSLRLASKSSVSVVEASDSHPHWIRVKNGQDAPTWIITKYVSKVLSGGTEPSAGESASYVIGCWNLEHFGEGKTRGFPENGYGGPSIPPRTDSDLRDIAQTITTRLGAKLLVLSEINGETGTDEDGDPAQCSRELEQLLVHLPATWTYRIAASGQSQRLAFLYDRTTVRLEETIEIEVPLTLVQGKHIFARHPFVAYVKFLQNDQPKNDLVIVALHLASQQDLNENHDAAMKLLRNRLKDLQHNGQLGGEAEADIVILGDMNANMFSPPAEQFFVEMDDDAGEGTFSQTLVTPQLGSAARHWRSATAPSTTSSRRGRPQPALASSGRNSSKEPHSSRAGCVPRPRCDKCPQETRLHEEHRLTIGN